MCALNPTKYGDLLIRRRPRTLVRVRTTTPITSSLSMRWVLRPVFRIGFRVSSPEARLCASNCRFIQKSIPNAMPARTALDVQYLVHQLSGDRVLSAAVSKAVRSGGISRNESKPWYIRKTNRTFGDREVQHLQFLES